jgi:DNA (cytosine-5)-methyltransferase 1
MRAVELFCGAGGMSLGLRRAGFELVRAYDAWDRAVDVYRANLGPHAREADLKDIFAIGPELARLAPDLICGGPPCQDFSAAGRREERENAALTRAFAMLVAVARPRWFLMENVTRALNSDAWHEARAMLTKAGYGLTECKLDASLYGVAQRRRRLIVIGRLGEADGFLQSAIRNAASQSAMTVRDLFGDNSPEAIYVHPRMPGKKGLWSADEPAPTMRSSSRRPIPADYEPHPDDALLLEKGAFFTRPFHLGRGVRTLDEPAPAIIRTSRERPRPHYLRQPHPDDPVHPSEAAVLTQVQVSRIQGFPSDWDWSPGRTKRDIDQLIANAVPPPLAEAIGRVILAREAGETIPAIEGRFGQWLRRRGLSPQSVRNAKTRVNRARRLLAGRTFADPAIEIAALERVGEFVSLPIKTQSDLRSALRLYREWLEEKASRSAGKAPKAAPEPIEETGMSAAAA